MKACKECHALKPITEFHKTGICLNTGKPKRRNICKPCYNSRMPTKRAPKVPEPFVLEDTMAVWATKAL